MHSRVRSVCVYCGSSHGVRPSFSDAATRLGAQLAEAGIRLVYGGGAVGLMGVVAQSVLDSGGQVTGIIPDFLDRAEVGKTNLTELIKTETMHDRKAIMAERSDGFVVLPGGLGTLDETFEILTWKQLQLHNKPIVLVNVEGYWDHFVHLVEHQVREGFVRERYLQFFRIVDTVEEVVPALLEDAAAAADMSDRLDRA
ncbi:MAG: TIGR00730 family Rossman fold protein [Alphaproteobacteria bacterium]|uniref:LOG family protein n=1 Tax=Pacificispira sp. TaxID=2888761 RepID=UPI002EA8AE67|nr:TIGR00730 family Rossman fold protein [Pseudomonadota bacterium]